MKISKVGLVGLRRGTIFGHVFNDTPRTEGIALCDTDREALEKARKAFGLRTYQCFHDYSDLVKTDLDVVVVATPLPYT